MIFVDTDTGAFLEGELRRECLPDYPRAAEHIYLTEAGETRRLSPYRDEGRFRLVSATLDEVSRMDAAGYFFRRV